MDFIVGSFNHDLYTLHFQPPSTLTVLRSHPSIGGHSWLALSPTKTHLYCTAWTKPHPSLAAYKIAQSGRHLAFLNAVRVQATSGYVCVSPTHLYSAGGPTGEVFRLNPDGSIGDLVQTLDFVDRDGVNQSADRGAVPHGDFGGLRHGAHSVDLSPDGRNLYIADIGRNCIWTYTVHPSPPPEFRLNLSPGSSGATATATHPDPPTPHLTLGSKHISPRPHDGPRHTWPHPTTRILYSLQEHTSMVDLFAIDPTDGTTLHHLTGVNIIPADQDPKDYWADEVRLSPGPHPRHLYASTRGLTAATRGYVAVFALDPADGTLASDTALHIWQTPTSGGIANAIEPAPRADDDTGVEYLAMTDSEEGWVFMLGFDPRKGEIGEVARVNLGKTEEGEVVKAATAVWL